MKLVEENRRELEGILKGVSALRQITKNRYYCRVKIETDKGVMWFSHFGGRTRLAKIYDKLEVGDKVKVVYKTRPSGKYEAREIISIAKVESKQEEEKKEEPKVEDDILEWIGNIHNALLSLCDELKMLFTRVRERLYGKEESKK